MKFTINKNDIVDVLSKVQGLTNRKSNLAITECLLIKAVDETIHLTATDLETGFEGIFPANVEATGRIAISARKFYEIVREFPNSDINIQESGNRRIIIGNDKVQFNLMTMNTEDYPPVPNLDGAEFFDVDESDLKKMIEKSTIISGIGEDKKAHINGIWFEILTDRSPQMIRMVSTDGSRLSKYDIQYKDDYKLPKTESILVPKKGLHEVGKFLQTTNNTVQIGFLKNYFILKSPYETFYIRLLEGQFPKYEDVIIRTDGHTIPLDKESFLNMLKRMSILCTDDYRAAIFTFEENRMVINSTNPNIGDSVEDMEIEYKGEKIEAAFNPRFFIDAVNGINDDHLALNIVNKNKPCLVEGADDKAFISVIMPMKVE